MIQNKLIGLALSGGGVRAAAFHLGVLDKLNEIGILKDIDIISTVSGGSIVGAYYLSNYEDFKSFKQSMIDNLKKSIEKRILLNWRMIEAIFKPSYSRTDVKSYVYDQIYFKEKTLSELKRKPKLIINATNLATGKNWKFTQQYMGDWKIGYEGNINGFKISNAVAASSAVPGVFHPFNIDISRYFEEPHFNIKRIALCDGGIYDNQGIHALISDYDRNRCCDYIICSDASFPFDDTPQTVSTRLVKVLYRQNDVMMARIRNFQFIDLIYGQHKNQIKTSYISISWTVENIIKSYIKQEQLCKKLGIRDVVSNIDKNILNLPVDHPEFLKVKKNIFSVLKYPELENHLTSRQVNEIAHIGTRLRSLSDEEIHLLMHHGSTLAGIQIRSYLGELLKN